MTKERRVSPSCTHWRYYLVESDGERILAIHHYEIDSDPTPIGQFLLNALDPGVRIPQPMVRVGLQSTSSARRRVVSSAVSAWPKSLVPEERIWV